MSTAVDKLSDEALALPIDARIALVDRLLMSLNLPTQPEIDRLWAEEAERRVSQIEKGKAELVPGEDVFAKIRAKHGK